MYEVHKDGVQSRKHRLEPGKIKSKCASHILKSSLDTQGAEDGPSRVEISDSTKESNHSGLERVVLQVLTPFISSLLFQKPLMLLASGSATLGHA